MKKKEALSFLQKLDQKLSKLYFSDVDEKNSSNLKNEHPLFHALNVLKSEVSAWPQDHKSKGPGDSWALDLPPELKNLKDHERVGFGLFADGACRGNPGPGSYAFILLNQMGDKITESSGVDMQTTNNKMELMGIIQGLQALFQKFLEDGFSQSDVPVYVYSDSKYVVDGLNLWLPQWKERGFKKADGKAPENVDLWKELDQLRSQLSSIQFIWVKGHAGHPQNEYCDKLANLALDEAGF